VQFSFVLGSVTSEQFHGTEVLSGVLPVGQRERQDQQFRLYRTGSRIGIYLHPDAEATFETDEA
jgi:hypothetical protein